MRCHVADILSDEKPSIPDFSFKAGGTVLSRALEKLPVCQKAANRRLKHRGACRTGIDVQFVQAAISVEIIPKDGASTIVAEGFSTLACEK